MTAGMRIHGTIQAHPAEVFAEHEAGVLLPLPQARYDVPVFTSVKVHRDFHVEVARSLYSAPKEYLGRHLDARADSTLVKLFHRGQLARTHPRAEPGRRVTDPAAPPEHKTAYAERDAASRATAARGPRAPARAYPGPRPGTAPPPPPTRPPRPPPRPGPPGP